MVRLFVGWGLAARLTREASRDGRPFHTDRCKAPLSVGLFRFRILLPMQSENWGSEKLGAVLTHEQAHVRRRDPLKDLDPGSYSLEVKVLDRGTGQTVAAGADFTVKR